MERKSSVKDVHQCVKKDYPEIYKTVCSKLGENNPFAKFSIGAGVYVWSDNRCQWNRMVDASELKQSVIYEAFNQKKAEFAAKIGQKSADTFFTVPDDSYIYYNDDNGDVKILIAGWGFKKPVRFHSSGEIGKVTGKNPVSVSFSYDGERLKNYDFGLKLPRQVKRLSTDINGLYVFPNLKVGEKYIVTDMKSGKDFPLNIVAGQSLYDFDVTRYSVLDISAVCDDLPINGEVVEVIYHGKRFDATTDGNGCAVIRLPLYDGEPATASMRDKTESTPISESGGEIDFVFETEKIPEPEKKIVDIHVSVMKDGSMLASQPVTVNYGGTVVDGVTDANGIFSKQMEDIPDAVCTVSVPDFEPQSKKLENDSLNKFVFEKTTVQPPVDETFNPHILVKRENGEIVDNYPISVEYEGKVTDYVSNAEGIVVLSDLEDGKTIKVTDGMNPDNTEEHVLDKEQDEYIFIIPVEVEPEPKDIKVMFRDLKGNPIVCKNVVFKQEGKPDLTLKLDDNGETCFKESTFELDTTINAQIIGWNNPEQYLPIPFTLEKDEYLYLLQEKESETKSSWIKILLEILAVLAAISSLLLLWPFFEGFCHEMFNLIY